MNKIGRKKLDAFALRHKLKPAHKALLATSLKGASAAQVEVVLSQASVSLLSHKVMIRPASPILDAAGKTQEAVLKE